ncbi:hypothetical protein AB9M75_04120 [Lactobacillus sp. AN1001]
MSEIRNKNLKFKADSDYVRWLDAQDNANASIRFLIQRAIAVYGNTDVLEKVAYDGRFADNFLVGNQHANNVTHVAQTQLSIENKKDEIIKPDIDLSEKVDQKEHVESEKFDSSVNKENASNFFGTTF